MKLAGHHFGPQWERTLATGPIVAAGQGHQEIVATPSLPKSVAETHVVNVRIHSRLSSRTREREIERGLNHDTVAMRANKEELGEIKE